MGALAVAAAAGAAAARGRPGAGGAGATLADGVRRLRAAAVGDVREGAADGGRVGALGALGTARGPAGLVLPRWRGRVAKPFVPDAAGLSATPGARDAPAGGTGEAPPWHGDRTAATLTAEAGDTLALPAELGAGRVRLEVEGAVSLLPGGRVVLGAPGEAAVVAVSATGRTRTPLLVRPVVRGAVYPVVVSGDETLGGPIAARVIVRRGNAVDTAWAGADGRFRAPTAPGTEGETAEVRVEAVAAPTGARPWGARPDRVAFSPVTLRDVPVARLHALGVVLLPARWTVTAGHFAGTTVAVRAEAARGFWQFTREPRDAHGAPVGWIHEPPYAVALDRGFDRADSATFWRAARAVEAAWGRRLFVPAEGADGSAQDRAEVVVRTTPELAADGFTSIGWDGSGTVTGAVVDLRVRRPGALDAGVVAHELVHVLGFGHARGWASVLAPAGRASTPEPTAADVTYAELYDAVRRAARRAAAAYGAAYGWPDAAP